jgi:hypothetical protein
MSLEGFLIGLVSSSHLGDADEHEHWAIAMEGTFLMIRYNTHLRKETVMYNNLLVFNPSLLYKRNGL